MARKPQEKPPGRWPWLLLCGLLVCWAFVLGVLVGQGALFSREQRQWLRKQAQRLPVVGAWLGPRRRPAPPRLTRPHLTYYQGLTGKEPSPAPVARPMPQPPSKPPSGRRGTGAYSVQVASFSSREQAENLALKLQAAGHPAYVLPARLAQGVLRFRVRVGSYGSRAQAQQVARRMRLQHRLGAYLVRDK